MSSFWRNFYYWLYRKLSRWQLPVQSVIKISSKWRHFRRRVMKKSSNIWNRFSDRRNLSWYPVCTRWVDAAGASLGMMTSSNGNIFRVTGPLCGEFTGPGEFPTQRPVTRNFDVFFDLRPNKRLNKQPWCWWFETLSCSLWRQRNGNSESVSTPWRHHVSTSLPAFPISFKPNA